VHAEVFDVVMLRQLPINNGADPAQELVSIELVEGVTAAEPLPCAMWWKKQKLA